MYKVWRFLQFSAHCPGKSWFSWPSSTCRTITIYKFCNTFKHFYEKENTKKLLIQYSIQVIGNTLITINKRASELEHNRSTTFIIIQNCQKLLWDVRRLNVRCRRGLLLVCNLWQNTPKSNTVCGFMKTIFNKITQILFGLRWLNIKEWMLFKDISFPWQATVIFLDSLSVMQVLCSQISKAEVFNILGREGVTGWVLLEILRDCSAFILSDC